MIASKRAKRRPSHLPLTQDIARWGNRLLICLNVVMLAVAGRFVVTRGVAPAPAGWTYAELISVLLTAIGVLLAIVALFVALLAIWGYNALREAAAIAATDCAEEIAERVAREVAEPIANRAGTSTSETVEDAESEMLEAALKGGSDHG